MYTVDMAEGFGLMQRLEERGVARNVAFVDVFGPKLRYVRQTYGDNLKVWDEVARIEGAQAQWISHGRTNDGKWSEFRKFFQKS
jgi:hypothetical protein